MKDSDNSSALSAEHPNLTIKASSSPSRSARLQEIIDKNATRSPPPDASKKMYSGTGPSSSSFGDPQIQEAATVVSSHLSTAMESLAGLAFSFFDTPQAEAASAKQKASNKQDLDTTTSTINTEDESLLQSEHDEPVRKAKSTDTGSSNGTSLPPPSLKDTQTDYSSMISPNVHRPIPTTRSASRTMSPDTSVPMARMREEESTIFGSIQTQGTAESNKKPEVNSDDIVAKKHRKWHRKKRQLEAQRRRARQNDLMCGAVPPASQGPSDILNRLLGNTHRTCYNVADVLYESSSSDESEYTRETLETRESEYTCESSETDSDADSAPSQPRRRGEKRTPQRQVEDATDVKVSVVTPDVKPAPLVKNEPPKELTKPRPLVTDRNFIKDFIAQTSSEGLALIWHQPETVETYEAPTTVKARLEHGTARPDGGYAGPRFVWRQAGAGGSIDLFDIHSLDKVSPLQLEAYPFAMPGNSFIIRLSSGADFVFEASSDTEAWRIIHGLRWVVARLAFNLVIGNQDVSCELLSVDAGGKLVPSGERGSPQSPLDEIALSRAMDDVTNLLVDKSVFVASSAED